jgi:hypothetical protein
MVVLEARIGTGFGVRPLPPDGPLPTHSLEGARSVGAAKTVLISVHRGYERP